MRLAFALALARAAGAAAPRNATLAVDASALPPLVIAGADKGGTSDAFELLLRHGFASKQKFECEDPSSSPKVRDLCVARSKELGCLYRGGDAASHRDCYRRYAVRGALWMDATPNYLWGWVNGEDAASRLSALSPNSAVAVLLRKPVARLGSLFAHWRSRPIGDELGAALEPHVLADLAYLDAMRTDSVYEIVKGKRVVFARNVSVPRLFGPGGAEVFSLLLRDYPRWAGRALDRATCEALVGDKQRTAGPFEAWRNYVSPPPSAAPRPCARKKCPPRRPAKIPPCPVFVNFVLTSVRRWVDAFPGRVAVVQSEYYFADRAAFLAAFGLAPRPAFAGPPAAPDAAEKVNNRGAYAERGATALTAATRAALARFYERPNAELRALLAARRDLVVVPEPDVAGSWWTMENG
ncbi:peroxiredoxin [Aureococcus anophagefferens]|uniref:Peroxiredoxin n=1 Tax=Aureococcus anophagefferens TaxID=44056 RepID=A0ABR1G7N7_AURAN